MLPSRPHEGATLANATATTMPTKKKCLLTNNRTDNDAPAALLPVVACFLNIEVLAVRHDCRFSGSILLCRMKLALLQDEDMSVPFLEGSCRLVVADIVIVRKAWTELMFIVTMTIIVHTYEKTM
jgi:hypothetical protein